MRRSSRRKQRKRRPDALSPEESCGTRRNAGGHWREIDRRIVFVHPRGYRLKKPLNLPGPLSEAEVIRYFEERGAENSLGYSRFLGAGVYQHLRSVVTDAILQRGEFLTSYTPYQAEIAQGTLQAIFEFQTLMCQLTGQEVANASMYDGSTADDRSGADGRAADGAATRAAGAVACILSIARFCRPTRRNSGLTVEEIVFGGRWAPWIRKRCRNALRDDVAAVVVQSPNFFGVIESTSQLAADIAHCAGLCWWWRSRKASSLGLVKPPAEADIVAMEGQSFGLAPSYGGPFVGVMASRDKFVRQLPGRLAGQTTDIKRPPRICVDAGHARATYPARKSHFEHLHQSGTLRSGGYRASDAARERRYCARWRIRICPRRTFALTELEKIPGVAQAFAAPFFNEFTVQLPRSVKLVNAQLLKAEIVGPFVLGTAYPELTKHALVCVTETTTRAEIEHFAAAVRRVWKRRCEGDGS